MSLRETAAFGVGVMVITVGTGLAIQLIEPLLSLFFTFLINNPISLVVFIGLCSIGVFVAIAKNMHIVRKIRDNVTDLWSFLNEKWKYYFKPQNQALLRACHDHDVGGMQKAFEKGADVNAVDENGNTPLLIMLSKNTAEPILKENIIKTVQLLLGKGADPLIFNNEKHNALSLIIKLGFAEAIPLFEDKKIYNQLRRGKTPLMAAANRYYQYFGPDSTFKVIEKLLACGAETNLKSQVKQLGSMTPFVYIFSKLFTTTPPETAGLLKLCDLFLDKGANPSATIEKMQDGKMTHQDYFLSLSAEQIQKIKPLHDRCIQIIEKREIAFSIPEGIAQSTDEQLLNKTVLQALHYQAAGDRQTIEKLTTLFVQESNTAGITSLIRHITPAVDGYASLHHQLVIEYSNMADTLYKEKLGNTASGKMKDISLLADHPEAQQQVLEYRQLAMCHCLKGTFSQEKDAVATRTVNELKRLYQVSFAEWKMEKPTPSSVDLFQVDIIDEVTKNLMEGAKAQVQLFKMRQQSAIAGPILRSSPSQHNPATPLV